MKIQKRSVILTLVLVFQLFSSTIFAQIPQKMSYQAVIRDASKALVTNKTIGMRVRIAQGTQSGTIVYTETFSPTTNINGLVSLEIGGAAGFSSINWANGPFFILTDADLTGGSSYTISGYSQLVSVPYALHAKTAETLSGGIIMPSGNTLPTPVSPTGSFFFNTATNVLYVSNGTAWLPVSTDGSTPSGTTFPTPTAAGDLFYNTASKLLYYWDGTNWKLTSNIPSGTTLPAVASSVLGDPFFKTDTNTFYIFNGTSWNMINGLSSTLANGSLFVGNASNVATPTTKANIPLSGFGAATTDVSLGNKNITNLATPLIDADAANKAYVDSKSSTTPTGPTLPAVVGAAGNTFFNTTDKVLYISDGTKWLPVATDGSTPSGPTFPPLPSPGDVFFNTATNSYYYYDGTSWKVASSIPTGTTLPATGTAGDPFFKSDTNTLYVYSGGIWNVAGLSNILANGSFFVGNASNIATPTTKVTIPLSGFGAPTTDVSMGSLKLTNLASPTANSDAANKAYVDLKTATTPSGPTNPPVAGANVGDVFYNTATSSFYYFDGTNWKLISSVPSGPTLPPTGNAGDTFYNTSNNTLYVNNGTTWNSTKVQADWAQNTPTADDYIKNKPTALVTNVSVITTNGVSGTVATPTSTPAITLTLGNITPTSVAATGTITGSNISGSNTGDQNASQVSVTPAGNITSTNVQAALVELQGDINGLSAATHVAVTLGTETNGLSLTGQQLSLAASTATTPGAMSAADKTKLDGIAAGAEVNVQADWNEATITADAYIKNKPVIYTALQLSTNFPGSALVHWLNITNTPTTLAGYGITNAMSTAHAANVITAANIANWNAAFGWGNHNLMGYVTNVTATLPLSSSGGPTPDISISKANTTTDGYLSTADWNTFNNKESSLTAGTTSQYYRGDKTWQTLDKAAVGLANVDNTTDLNKPISTATQGALDLKENIGNKSTNVALGNSDLLYPTQNAVKNYVDNQITTNATPDATTLEKGKLKLAGDLGGTADLPSVLKINGASLGTTTATNTNILIANGTTWESKSVKGDVTITNQGVVNIGKDKVNSNMILDGTISDVDLDKVSIPLSGFGDAKTFISLGDGVTNYQITNLAAPSLPTDATNKKYVDEAVNVPGKLYQGTTADVTSFNALSWATISAATDKGAAIPNLICNLDNTTKYTWIAFPKAWGTQNFFYRYGGNVYPVFDGFEKRVVSNGAGVDYQVWVFKTYTIPAIPVDLIVNN